MPQEKHPDSFPGTTARSQAWWDQFRTLLDELNEWPAEYMFKFIVPQSSLAAIKTIFDGQPVRVRASSRGNYLSVTARVLVDSSEDVIAIYASAGDIEGVISL